MVAYSKFNVATRDLLSAKHDFTTHVFKALLSDVAPIATNAVKADLTDIAAGNGYVAGGPACAVTVAQVSGTQWKATFAAFTITATGAVGPFRYVAFYNDTQASPAKPLWDWFDLGQEVTLANTQTFTFTPDQTNGNFSVT